MDVAGMFTRRSVIRGAIGSAAVVGLDTARPRQATARSASAATSFVADHQPGISTRAQRHGLFVAFDLADLDDDVSPADRLRDLLEGWTITGEEQMRGEGFAESDVATGLAPANLTVTTGFGPSLFERIGRAEARPALLSPLPEFDGDAINSDWSGGDLLVQICGDDAQVVSAAFLAMRGRTSGLATLRWTQQGFISHPADGGTPRNILGHKDGTANPAPGPDLDDTVWVGDSEPEWFRGGTYMVFRKIRADMPGWALTPVPEQDAVIGRTRETGAPLSGGDEHTPVDLDATDPDGHLLLAEDSHVRLVLDTPMLRRPYNYDYGFISSPPSDHQHSESSDESEHSHAGSGGHARFDAGILFAAYMRDPATFVSAQHRLAASDRLNAFISHTGSAIFAIPPGTAPGAALASGLLER